MSQTAAISVPSATAVQLAVNDGPQRKTYLIRVSAGGPVNVGGPDVTATVGVEIASTDPVLVVELVDDEVFAAVATGGAAATVQVAEFVSGPAA